MFRMICNIARTELQLLFYSPVAWLLLVVFTVQSALIFSTQFSMVAADSEIGRNVAGASSMIFSSWTGVFPSIQGYLYFYIPLLTMGLVSKELSSGSVRLLYSSPITNVQIILGKYFSVMLYGLVMMGVLVLLALVGGITIKHFEWPAVLTGILGLYLLLCAYGAIGLFMSSLTSYQIVAAIGTLIVLMLLSMVGGWWQSYDFVRDITYWLSINGRCDTFIHGMICSEDLLYFLIIICLFLSLTIIRLNAVRQKIPFSVTVGKNVGVILVACLLGYFSSLPALKSYYDATENKRNTLTETSQKIMAQLTGGLTVTSYINVLDPDAAWYLMELFLSRDKERYERYQRFKPEMKLKYVYYYDTTYNPSLDKRYPGESLREKMVHVCETFGVDTNKVLRPEEIRSIVDLSGENNTFVVQLARENGEKAWLRVFNDMMRYPDEREISVAFKRMVMKLPVVGFLTGHGERGYGSNKDRDYSAFANDKKFRYALMNQGFDVENVRLDKEIREDINILVIAENRETFTPEEDAVLQQYIDRGGNLFVLGEPRRREVMNPLFAKFGFEMMPGVLVKQDTNLQADVILSYPTKEAGDIAYDFGNLREMRRVVVTPGVAGLRQVDDKGFTVTELFKSDTIGSWNELETVDFVDDTVSLNKSAGEVEQSYPTVVALSRMLDGREQRIILAGDADCISNEELMGSRKGVRASNFTLIMGGFYWLSNNEAPLDVRRVWPTDDHVNVGASGAENIKWVLVLVWPILLAGVGIFVWLRRKGR